MCPCLTLKRCLLTCVVTNFSVGFFALVTDRIGGRSGGRTVAGTTAGAFAMVSPDAGVVVARALGGVTTGKGVVHRVWV